MGPSVSTRLARVARTAAVATTKGPIGLPRGCRAHVCNVRAWVYKEQLREILARKQIDVVRQIPMRWCTNVMRVHPA